MNEAERFFLGGFFINNAAITIFSVLNPSSIDNVRRIISSGPKTGMWHTYMTIKGGRLDSLEWIHECSTANVKYHYANEMVFHHAMRENVAIAIHPCEWNPNEDALLHDYWNIHQEAKSPLPITVIDKNYLVTFAQFQSKLELQVRREGNDCEATAYHLRMV
jgi:hypothetical protein